MSVNVVFAKSLWRGLLGVEVGLRRHDGEDDVMNLVRQYGRQARS